MLLRFALLLLFLNLSDDRDLWCSRNKLALPNFCSSSLAKAGLCGGDSIPSNQELHALWYFMHTGVSCRWSSPAPGLWGASGPIIFPLKNGGGCRSAPAAMKVAPSSPVASSPVTGSGGDRLSPCLCSVTPRCRGYGCPRSHAWPAPPTRTQGWQPCGRTLHFPLFLASLAPSLS